MAANTTKLYNVSKNSVSTLTILINKKHGFLSRLYLRIESLGYSVVSHQIKPSMEEGLELIELNISGKLPLPEKLTQSIINIPECIEFVDNTGNIVGQDNHAEKSKKSRNNINSFAKQTAKEVASVYPNVAIVLDHACNNVEPSEKQPMLFQVGVFCGMVIHNDKYSLGLPMKLPQLVKHAILPTLKPIADVTYSDNQIHLTNNNCCSSNPSNSRCEFVLGLVRGLLQANKATKNKTVTKTACVSESGNVCTFVLA